MRHLTILTTLIVLSLLALSPETKVFGAPLPPPPNTSGPAETPRDGPISISADHMTANDNSKIVTFTGRVVARQDDLIISCEVMKVHYQPRTTSLPAPPTISPPASEGLTPSRIATTPGAEVLKSPPDIPDTAATLETQTNQISKSPAFSGGQEIEKVECVGDVKIQQGDRLAVGQKATYLARSTPRRLILTGDARVWQGRNAVTGHEVTYFLDENRSQVESQNKSRVRAFYEKPVPKNQSK